MCVIKKIILYTDTHIGAPHKTRQNADSIISEFQQKNESTLLLATGDIFDIKNTKKKYIKERKMERDKLKNILGNYYIFGNHECAKDPGGKYFYVENGIVWLHYHVPDWCYGVPDWSGSFDSPCPKVIEWEEKECRGLNYLNYKTMQTGKKIKSIFSRDNWKPKDKELDKIADFAKLHSCHTVVFGHTHRFYDKYHKDIRIINGGMDRTDYDI